LQARLSASQNGLNVTSAPSQMIEERGFRPTSYFHSLSSAAALTICLVGLSVLAGWTLGLRSLTSVFPGLATMKANTAACFVLASVALWGRAADGVAMARRRLATVCAALVTVIALLTLFEYLGGVNLGIDQILFRDQPEATALSAPGRMAPATAFCFLLLGSGLALLGSRRGPWVAQYLSLGTGLIALLALIGYAYGVQSLYRISPFSSMALHTAASFLVLSAGLFFVRPRDALMAIVTNHGAGGAVTRRLLPATVLVPFTLGWICLAGQRAGLYDTDFGVALFAVSNIVVIGGLTWWLAGRLHRSDVERRRAAEGLRAAHETLEAIVDASPVAIAAVDMGGRVTTWSASAEKMFGWTRDDILGRPLPQAPANEGPGAVEVGAAVLQGALLRNVEATRRRKDGSDIQVSLSAAPLYDAAQRIRGGIAVFADITERRKLEEQVRQSQKLEAVGRLAGGVAHDFNNLLTVIGGCIELTLLRLPPDNTVRKNIEEAGKATRRAAVLTNQLLAFSRKQVLEPKILDLNEIVRGMEKMLARLIGEDVILALSCGERLGRVKADRGQIEQVIMNLAVNARDAMPRGGRLTIETRDAELDAEYAARHAGVRAGPYVMLAVSDTGVGMSPEIQGRIFEPFFTTKEPGKGTGLGLSTVYGIVKQSAGYIYVYSEPGRGTTFKVYLQPTEGPVEVMAEPPSQTAPAGRETILLVEDDALVRDVVQRMLSGFGYTVLEAAGGDEALAICEKYTGSIDLLMTDVVMPKANGRQVAEHAARLRPRLRVLYMSGYTDEAIVKLGMLEPGLFFLHKPFSRDVVGRKVREVIEQRKPHSDAGAA